MTMMTVMTMMTMMTILTMISMKKVKIVQEVKLVQEVAIVKGALGKPHIRILHVQTAFCQIAFQPTPPRVNGRFVAGILKPKISKFFKTAFLTSGIDILTITMDEHDS